MKTQPKYFVVMLVVPSTAAVFGGPIVVEICQLMVEQEQPFQELESIQVWVELTELTSI